MLLRLPHTLRDSVLSKVIHWDVKSDNITTTLFPFYFLQKTKLSFFLCSVTVAFCERFFFVVYDENLIYSGTILLRCCAMSSGIMPSG